MKRAFRLTAVCATAAVITVSTFMGCGEAETKEVSAATTSSPSALERGKYLIENVGLCADCHSPRTKEGLPDPENHLTGAMIGFDPKGPVPGWVGFAPKIAGLPNGWTQENMAHFLQTSEKPGGKIAGPPMPPYRLSPEDARAAAEYLASLKK